MTFRGRSNHCGCGRSALRSAVRFVLVAAAVMGGHALAHYDNLELGVSGACDQIVNREGYALGFSRRHRQALWVSYRLTEAESQSTNASRKGLKFYVDDEVLGCAALSDYRGTGYDRGHLVPAGDMKFSARAMLESFSLANASPQVKSFNCGVWHRLETTIRNLAIREKSLFIVSGPIFGTEEVAHIGRGRVSVPKAFYKVAFDETPPVKMIGFIVPNSGAECPLSNFAVTVDEVERITGLDFFSALPDECEVELESHVDVTVWTF